MTNILYNKYSIRVNICSDTIFLHYQIINAKQNFNPPWNFGMRYKHPFAWKGPFLGYTRRLYLIMLGEERVSVHHHIHKKPFDGSNESMAKDIHNYILLRKGEIFSWYIGCILLLWLWKPPPINLTINAKMLFISHPISGFRLRW